MIKFQKTVVSVSLVLTLMLHTSAIADEILQNPDAEVRELLLEKLARRIPDFEQLSQKTDAYNQADEFDRDGIGALERGRLNRVWDSLDNTQAIQFSI